jgi:hypothetical protein
MFLSSFIFSCTKTRQDKHKTSTRQDTAIRQDSDRIGRVRVRVRVRVTARVGVRVRIRVRVRVRVRVRG